MAVIKKNRKKSVPAVSTASLPDIIFTLLFFFMVSAKVKDSSLKVDYQLPSAVDSKKLTSQDKPLKFHIGKTAAAYRDLYGPGPLIQYKGTILKNPQELAQIVPPAIQEVPRDSRDDIWFSLKVGKEIPYSFIDEVKTELRKADALRINYDASNQSYQ